METQLLGAWLDQPVLRDRGSGTGGRGGAEETAFILLTAGDSEHMQHLSLKTSAEAEYLEGKCQRLREAVTQKHQPFYFSKPTGG